MGSQLDPLHGNIKENNKKELKKQKPFSTVDQVLVHEAVLREYTCKLECRPMSSVMVALPNIGGALCSTPQTLADAHY